MTKLSPFAEIFETKTYPHARTLRTSFLEKVVDAFYVLTGKEHLGIFHYLTLFIPEFTRYLLTWCINNVNAHQQQSRQNKFYIIFARILLVPAILINIPLQFARAIFGYTVTLLCLPIIAIVHFFSRIAAGNSNQSALNIMVKSKGKNITLSKCLQENNIDIEDLSIEPTKGNNNYSLILFSRKTTYNTVAKKVITSIEFPTGNSTNDSLKPSLHSLFRLNIGEVVANIEKSAALNTDDKKAILAI